MEITSAWRPLTGSRAHRLGWSLDIKNVKDQNGKLVIFDKKLGNKPIFSDEAEKQAHADWIAAEKKKNKAEAELKQAKKARTKAFGEEGIKVAKTREDNADAALKQAKDDLKDAKEKFNDRHKGTLADSVEQALLQHPLISQLYDPLIIEHDTTDANPPQVNANISGLETGHQNHLHITIRNRDFVTLR